MMVVLSLSQWCHPSGPCKPLSETYSNKPQLQRGQGFIRCDTSLGIMVGQFKNIASVVLSPKLNTNASKRTTDRSSPETSVFMAEASFRPCQGPGAGSGRCSVLPLLRELPGGFYSVTDVDNLRWFQKRAIRSKRTVCSMSSHRCLIEFGILIQRREAFGKIHCSISQKSENIINDLKS